MHTCVPVCIWPSLCARVCACTCTCVCIHICTNGVSRDLCFFCLLFIYFKELDDVIMEVSWIQHSSAGVRLRLKKELRFENKDCLLTGLRLGLDWAGRISVCFIKAYTDCMKLTSIYLGSFGPILPISIYPLSMKSFNETPRLLFDQVDEYHAQSSRHMKLTIVCPVVSLSQRLEGRGDDQLSGTFWCRQDAEGQAT